MSTSALEITRGRRVLADLLPGLWLRDVLLVIAGAGLTGALAQAVVHLPGTPVPITGQTLGVLLCGCALGSKRGGASIALYVVAGFLGLPWFAGGTHGWVGPNAGYLFGFIVAAFCCGLVAERGATRNVLTALPAMLLGEVAIYAFGVTWLAFDLHLGAQKALDLGFNPFVIGDALKVVIGTAALPAAWRLAGAGRSETLR